MEARRPLAVLAGLVLIVGLLAAPAAAQTSQVDDTGTDEMSTTEEVSTTEETSTTQEDPTADEDAATSRDTSEPTTDGDTESDAEAVAIEIDGVASVSETSASTGDGGSASAAPLTVGDETVIGGSQEGEGSSSGELFTTGEQEQGHLDVAPWNATVEGNGTSSSRAAIVDGNLGGEEGITLVILESRSQATEDGSSAESTGADLRAGDELHVRVLHAETSSDGEGSAYLVGINDQKIGSDEQFEGRCSLDAQPVVTLVCVEANERTADELEDGATSGGEAFVGEVTAVDDAVDAGVFTARTAESPAADEEPEVRGAAVEREPRPAAEDDRRAAGLPRTGAGFGLVPLALLAVGAGVLLVRRREPTMES